MSTLINNTGSDVKGLMTAREALAKADLDWTVSKRQVKYDGAVNGMEFSGKFVIARDDTDWGLGVVSHSYEIMQNKDAFSFMDAIVQEKMATYDRVFSLNGGSRIGIVAKLPHTVKVLGKDSEEIESYFLLTTTHDGSGSIAGSLLPRRVVCSNQLTGLAKRAQFKIRHTASMFSKIDAARNALGLVKQSLDDILNGAELLARTKLNTAIVDRFLKSMGLEPKPEESTRHWNIRENVLRKAKYGIGNNGTTLWDLYNGVTEYVDHKSSKSIEKAFASSMFGQGAVMKAEAFTNALEIARG